MAAESQPRFFDSRAAYMMFVMTTTEKSAIAERMGREIDQLSLGGSALRIFDAGLGDARVLAQLMQRIHKVLPYVPWLVVGKEISVEDVRHALEWLPDRLVEHPELVFVITNLPYRQATNLGAGVDEVSWRVNTLEGSTAFEFTQQIRQTHQAIEKDWVVKTSEKTGNPVPVRPAVHVYFRADRDFLLRNVVPAKGEENGGYDLILASQPYRAKASADSKVRSVVGPMAMALAPGGRLVGVHAHGNDPGLEIIHNVWPDERPFPVGRHELVTEAARQLADPGLEFPDLSDSESIFRYELQVMPSERQEHIGTSSILAAWNAAAYVAQIDEARLTEALDSGVYIDATRDVLSRHGAVWFNNESYLITRRTQ
ncbi:MAG TPA: hypothetical protein ENH15_06020 [Actinobacteria bacterium]|nr:hypothetical protein [Actinomycetota bacterium]